MTLTRPVLRYFGGKWMAAPKLIALMPPHRIYVEPLGGAASVLLRKPRVYCEIYNDLCGEVVNVFRMARDRGPELIALLKLTPFAREEYFAAFPTCDDSLEMARRTIVRSFMGFGSNSINRAVKSGFRANAKRSGTTPSVDWMHYPDCLTAAVDRLQGIVLENRDVVKVVEAHDGEETFFYFDPPYVHETRTRGAGTGARAGYHHEMTDADHVALMKLMRGIKGRWMLSGYRSRIYDSLLGDYRRVEFPALADGARPRTECVWMNYPETNGLL